MKTIITSIIIATLTACGGGGGGGSEGGATVELGSPPAVTEIDFDNGVTIDPRTLRLLPNGWQLRVTGYLEDKAGYYTMDHHVCQHDGHLTAQQTFWRVELVPTFGYVLDGTIKAPDLAKWMCDNR